ncbi:MAG: LPS export ABC transporter periplasmic protein LptC [bacterium]
MKNSRGNHDFLVDINFMSQMWKLFFVFFMVLTACQGEQQFTSSPQDLEDVPDQESWNATLTTTIDGKTNSKIKYSRMQKFTKKSLSKFSDGVEIDFFDSEGEHVSKIVSQNALFKETMRIIELTDSVNVLMDGSFQLQTEKIIWNERKESISTDIFVTIVTAESDTIHGIGFRSKKPFKDWSIKKPWGVTQRNLSLEVSKGNE